MLKVADVLSHIIGLPLMVIVGNGFTVIVVVAGLTGALQPYMLLTFPTNEYVVLTVGETGITIEFVLLTTGVFTVPFE